MNEIQFNLQTFFKTTSIPRNCVKTLPQSQKSKLNRIVFGDDQGTVQILDLSGDSLAIDSKYNQTQREVSMIDLAPQPSGEKDRVFFAQGGVIIGLTKKLKEFLRYDSLLADVIKYVIVEGNYIFTAGDYMCNIYSWDNDTVSPVGFYLCPDKINDMQAHYLSGSQKVNLILACQDSCVRTLLVDELKYQFQVSAPVLCMHVFAPEYKDIISLKRSEQRKCFVYGLQNGQIIIADMTMVKAVVLLSFQIDECCGISCLKPCNLLRSNETDLLVTRVDGVLELYSFENNQPILRGQKKINESITSIETGSFKTQNCEFVISTFSGRMILLQCINLSFAYFLNVFVDDVFKKGIDLKKDDKKFQKEQEQKIKQIKSEITKLEQQLNESLQKSSKDGSALYSVNNFKINQRLIKNEADGTYSWIIESQYPIESISMTSETYIEILNSEQEVITALSVNENESNCLFYLKDKTTNNFEIKFRSYEGMAHTVNAIIIPNAIPQTAQIISTEIKSLSLHQKIPNEINLKQFPLNTLNIKGSFSKSYMNMWINSLISDSPNQEEDRVTLQFKNVFSETYLQIKYKQGQALIKSDSVVTLYTCKQFIQEQANQRGIQIEIKWDILDESIHHLVSKLIPKIKEQAKITQQYELLPALKELKSQESDLSFLSKDFSYILENEENILNNFQKQPKSLEFLIKIVKDIYTSRCLFKGVQPQENKLKLLEQMVKKFQFNEIAPYIVS